MLSTEERRQPHEHVTFINRHTMGSLNQANGYALPEIYQHIWIITGPAGCGKTTVAKYLAHEMSLPYIEGDDVRND